MSSDKIYKDQQMATKGDGLAITGWSLITGTPVIRMLVWHSTYLSTQEYTDMYDSAEGAQEMQEWQNFKLCNN